MRSQRSWLGYPVMQTTTRRSWIALAISITLATYSVSAAAVVCLCAARESSPKQPPHCLQNARETADFGAQRYCCAELAVSDNTPSFEHHCRREARQELVSMSAATVFATHAEESDTSLLRPMTLNDAATNKTVLPQTGIERPPDPPPGVSDRDRAPPPAA